jgi:glycosyltransferase involved in cell wall biosynthesis
VNPPTASLVIRTYNERRYLPALLEAVAKQSVPAEAREVIVVDSGSTDDTPRIARDHGCRVIDLCREEFSFGRSLNVGCDQARGDVLVFISGHCVPTDGHWLERLITPLTDGVAMSYGRQVAADTSQFSEHQIFSKHFPSADEPAPNGFFCNNANAAITRRAWERFRFDESLTGLEDLHLGKRIVDAGLKIRYVVDATVRHHHHESWRQVAWRFEREALALQSIMPEIHVHWHDALRYFGIAAVRDWAKARAQGQLLTHGAAIVAYRACQYYGVWKGNHAHRRLSKAAKERYFYPR